MSELPDPKQIRSIFETANSLLILSTQAAQISHGRVQINFEDDATSDWISSSTGFSNSVRSQDQISNKLVSK